MTRANNENVTSPSPILYTDEPSSGGGGGCRPGFKIRATVAHARKRSDARMRRRVSHRRRPRVNRFPERIPHTHTRLVNIFRPTKRPRPFIVKRRRVRSRVSRLICRRRRAPSPPTATPLAPTHRTRAARPRQFAPVPPDRIVFT